VPLTFLLPLTSAAPAVVLVVAIGLLVDGGYYPLLIVAQDALPERDGLAAGVVLGLSVGGGAGATALLGRLADAHGPGATLWVCAALAAASLVLALPAIRRRSPAPGAAGAAAMLVGAVRSARASAPPHRSPERPAASDSPA
jgi:FSR family fosmidomycin resistance protein-like MFS transporter